MTKNQNKLSDALDRKDVFRLSAFTEITEVGAVHSGEIATGCKRLQDDSFSECIDTYNGGSIS